MGLTGQEERACVHDSMSMGWGRGGGDDGGCHGRYITAAAKLMHLHSQRTNVHHMHTQRDTDICMPRVGDALD